MKFFRWRQHKEEELDAEIQQHLDEAVRDRMERGESAEQARANVLREFGNVGLVKEVTREVWGSRFARTMEAGLTFWRANVAKAARLRLAGGADARRLRQLER